MPSAYTDLERDPEKLDEDIKCGYYVRHHVEAPFDMHKVVDYDTHIVQLRGTTLHSRLLVVYDVNRKN